MTSQSRRKPTMHEHKKAYRQANDIHHADVELVSGPSHLPDPGIPVFIRTREGLPTHNRIAALRQDRSMFVVATFQRGVTPNKVAVDAITGWDYAVPAGDLL
jgi:hypothetical protein